jgi:oxygen-independent coproporphyrinogen-3 oxidase
VPRDEYIGALISDIESYGGRGITLDSIFFGGGTPSVLSPNEFLKVCDSLKSTFDISPDCEFTVEANPATLNREKLSAYISAGVNRISLGLQSIHENELKILGRIHSYDEFLTTYRLCREHGIDNINVDLMYAFPEQTLDSFRETLDTVLALFPEHISLYGLILEEGTPLYKNKENFLFPDEDTELSMYLLSSKLLSDAGYTHYEISNYSKAGLESRHNLKYWRDEEYIGVGLSAYSYFGGARYGKTRDMHSYLKAPTENEYLEIISEEERKKEYIMLSLRLREGLSFADYRERFSEDFISGREEEIAEYERLLLISVTDGGIALTEQGFYVSNTIISSLI